MAKMRFIQAIKIAPNPKSEKIIAEIKLFWFVESIPQMIPDKKEIIIPPYTTNNWKEVSSKVSPRIQGRIVRAAKGKKPK